MSDFLKQGTEPLFPKVLWEKPLNRRAAKQLLIIGGHATEFSKTQLAYQEAVAAGLGTAKVVLPASVLKLTGNLPDCLFVPATPSGSIAKAALGEIESYMEESDGVLLAGEFSQNAETTSLLESLLRTTTKPLAMSDDVITNMLYLPELLFEQPERMLLGSTQTFAKLSGKLDLPVQIKQGAGLLNKIDLLANLYQAHAASYVLSGKETVVYANKQASTTNTPSANTFGDGVLATFWLQHSNSFEALTAAAFVLSQVSGIAEIKAKLNQLTN